MVGTILKLVFVHLAIVGCTISNLGAEDLSLMPKYGSAKKTVSQKASDQEFIDAIDQEYNGDRKKAAEDLSARGWQYLQNNKIDDAMRRFNQAWLLDSKNGSALWGMGAIQINSGVAPDASLKLFKEADQLIRNDLNFSIDYAKTIGFAAAQKRSDLLLKEALSRFENVYQMAPYNVLNLQNWAVTLYYAGRLQDAWIKIKLAEATPDKNQLDASFIAALEKAMPRPK